MVSLELFGHSIPSWLGLDLGFGIGNQDVAAGEPISVPDNGSQVPKEGATPEDEKGEAEVKKLACSRCESLDTKFCYFNNCNANQPRHYCRSCERYWTAGGTLRNTPMGSGRRKRKHSSVLPTSVMSRHLKKSSPQNFSYLSTSNSPKSSAPLISQDSAAVPIIEGIRPQGQKVFNGRATNGLSKLSRTASNERQACETTEASKQAAGFMGSSPFSFPMGPWPYGYGLFGWNNEAISPIPHIGGRSFITPSLNTWGLPWPLMPIPPWNIPPWGPTTAAVAMAKHCSEGLQTVAKTNACLFTPKTLRIQNSEEAAQSSIWSALGLDNRFDLPVSAAGIFNGLPLKDDHVVETEEPPLQTFHANPAATFRSMTYHENN